jgi:hypothetical protein
MRKASFLTSHFIFVGSAPYYNDDPLKPIILYDESLRRCNAITNGYGGSGIDGSEALLLPRSPRRIDKSIKKDLSYLPILLTRT